MFGFGFPLAKKDATTKDVEPLEYVIKWNNYYLVDGPLNRYQYGSVSFRWSKDLTKAFEVGKKMGTRIIEFYETKGYDAELKYRDLEE